MATVYTKQARRSVNGTVFAPGKCDVTGSYLIFKLCENYDGQVRGGIRKTWRYTDKGLTLDEAKAALEKRVGRKIYQPHQGGSGLPPHPLEGRER